MKHDRERRRTIAAIVCFSVTFLINVLETPFDTKLMIRYSQDPLFFQTLSPKERGTVTVWNVGLAVKYVISLIGWVIMTQVRYPLILEVEMGRAAASSRLGIGSS